MSSVTSEYLAAVKWAEESHSPLDFVKSTQLPQLGKVIKGQLERAQIGVPSPTHPTLNQTIFWLKVTKKINVLCQCVKFKEKDKISSSIQRSLTVGPHFFISQDVDAWFEIISEDGRSCRSIQSVSELVKRFPHSVLVREAIKVHCAKHNGTGDALVSEKSRLLQPGDVLQLDSLASFVNSKCTNDKYLKCFISSSGMFYFFILPSACLPCLGALVYRFHTCSYLVSVSSLSTLFLLLPLVFSSLLSFSNHHF